MNIELKKIDYKIDELNKKIERNMLDSVKDRGYMSQNLVKSLRDLVEYISFKTYIIETNQLDLEYNQKTNDKAIKYVKSLKKHRILKNFHQLLQIGTSHNSYSEDGSIRLMVRYQEYLFDLRDYYKKLYEKEILSNLSCYPIFYIEKSLIGYYEQIYENIKNISYSENNKLLNDIYYIAKSKMILFKNKKFYELTLIPASDYYNKYNRVIFYSPFKILDNYAIKISYDKIKIKNFDLETEIKIINNYMTFIRPVEINNLYKIFGIDKKISCNSKEYLYLMKYMTENKLTLNDIVNMDNIEYMILKNNTIDFRAHYVMELLDLCRNIILNKKNGSNVINYLIYMLRNNIVVNQISSSPCPDLSGLYLEYGCCVFDTTPYASHLIKHKINISDLIEIIDSPTKEAELLFRKISDLSNSTNRIYFLPKELGYTEEKIKELKDAFNSKVYHKHQFRKLEMYCDNIYIKEYEESTISIIEILNKKSESGVDDYSQMFNFLEDFGLYNFTDKSKRDICKKIFFNSKIGLIYGAAGTGKTEMIKIMSLIYINKKIALLTKTHAALNNLRLRINSLDNNIHFSVIDKFVKEKSDDFYDIVIVDECSMIENSTMLKLLDKTNFDALMLVGDIYQIESIEFGNWFSFAKDLISNCQYELEENFRTNNKELKELWNKVRNIDQGISEKIIDENYSEELNENVFIRNGESDIVLCLNYDGPYGINNINRYLQQKNPNSPVEWGVNVYKVNDPIIFCNVGDKLNILYNNLIGKIIGIEKNDNKITFRLLIEKEISDLERFLSSFKVLENDTNKSEIEIQVVKKENHDNEDQLKNIVPFVVSYATSIHKAQGLEFDTVKIIISNEVGDLITKNIFYTAITRTRKNLKIYWTAECQNNIINNMKNENLKKDLFMIKNRIKKEKRENENT